MGHLRRHVQSKIEAHYHYIEVWACKHHIWNRPKSWPKALGKAQYKKLVKDAFTWDQIESFF